VNCDSLQHNKRLQDARRNLWFAALASLMLLGSYIALAQQSPAPSPSMNFFVTSVTIGDGGNLGGLAGARQEETFTVVRFSSTLPCR
jgi:hypothetical protein